MACTFVETDFCIQQNASFAQNFQLFDDNGSSSLDVSGCSFTGSIRSSYTDPAVVMFFTMSVASYTTASINMYLGADSTWALSQKKYVYDVLMYNGNLTPPVTTRLLSGKLAVSPGVTVPVP